MEYFPALQDSTAVSMLGPVGFLASWAAIARWRRCIFKVRRGVGATIADKRADVTTRGTFVGHLILEWSEKSASAGLSQDCVKTWMGLNPNVCRDKKSGLAKDGQMASDVRRVKKK